MWKPESFSDTPDSETFDGERYEELWRYTTVANGRGIAATDERVFVALGDSITDISASSGERQWNVSTPAFADFGTAEGWVYAKGRRQGISVRDVANGSELWAESDGQAHVSRTGNVYIENFSEDSTFSKYDPDGNEIWRTEPLEMLAPPSASDSTNVYLAARSQGISAHSVDDGSQQWSRELSLRTEDVAAGSDGLYVLASGDGPTGFSS